MNPPGADKRGIRRSRVLKRGIVAFGGRQSTVECAVRNFSPTGCQISSDAHLLIPDTFELLIELEAMWYPCQVAWRKPPLVGVCFTGDPQPAKIGRSQVVGQATSAKPTLRRLPPSGPGRT